MTGPASRDGDGRLRSRPSAPVLAPGVRGLDDAGLPDHLLLVPPEPDRPRPLLVWFHGAGGSGARSVPVVAEAARSPTSSTARPRCWLAHGTQDAVLPYDRCGRRVAAQLQRAGYDVCFERFDGGHVVRPELLRRAVGWWLDDGPET